ncbi:PAS domain S-box protein [Thermodesulfobacteriota bacterium]
MQKAEHPGIATTMIIFAFLLSQMGTALADNSLSENQLTLYQKAQAANLSNSSDTPSKQIDSLKRSNVSRSGSESADGNEQGKEITGWLSERLSLKASSFNNYVPLITAGLGFLVILALLAILWNIKLHQVVGKRTRELTRAEQRFRSIVENSHDGILIADDKYILRYINDEFCKILGYEPEELLGKDFRQFLDSESRKIVSDKYSQEHKIEDPATRYQFKIVTKAGVKRNVESSSTVIRDSEGKVQTIARILDITERKKAEEALKESGENYRKLYNESKRAEQLYRSLIDSSADAIVILDLDGKTVYVSPEFTKGFGWTLEELVGKIIPFVPETEENATSRMTKDLIENGTPFRGLETRRRTKTGVILDVSISASRYNDHEGSPAGTLLTIRDITQRKKLHAQLQHSQRLESIGMIASGVAHNFRNILAGISVNNQLMEMKFKDNKNLLEIIGRVEGAVRRGAKLVDELMQFSRKNVTDEHKVIDLSNIIVETYDLIRESFDKKIDIQVDIPDSIPVIADQSGLSQVLMNLATNARDAMPEGGQIRIAAWKKRKQAEIAISDTGHGMDKATTAKCFDPFFTTKDVDRGTGLGLSTTYGIIREHGGDIHAYSEPGKGTIFKIYLPLALENEKPRKAPDSVSLTGKGRGEKVLIVDDEIEMLRPMEEMLETMGFKAAFAGSPQEGLEKYVQWKPDAVLMDRNMPQMDGNTCAARIIEKDPDAKIILVSGYDEKGPNGIDPRTKELIKGYLTKPVDAAELIRVLTRIFGL